jgi:uncharacterized cupin superfamily protein
MSAQSRTILYSEKLLGIRKLNNPVPAIRTQDSRIYLGVHHADAWKTASQPDRYQTGYYNADTGNFSMGY